VTLKLLPPPLKAEGIKKALKTAIFAVLKALLMAGWTRLELATSGLTGRRSNRLNYQPPIFNRQFQMGVEGFEPPTTCV
jgi:hypothetical protein